MKKRLLLVLFSLIMLLGVISLAGNVHAEESDPELTVVGCNLSFGSSIYIKYAIYSPDLDGIELLVWTDPQTSYEYGTQKLILNQLDKPETVQGKKCAVFKYTDLAAKQMGDTIYARAHVVRDGIDYYSEVKKYSVLQYAYNKLGRTGTAGTDGLRNLLNNMLNYGGAAQQYFNYDPDRLVTYDWYQVKVVGGTLDDMCYSGLYLPGDKVTLIAPETDENGDTFSAWVNPWGGIAADEATAEITVGEQNLTYTAVYGGSLAYYDNGDGSCTIIGVGNWVGRNLDIPSSIDGLTVTAIESYAFAGNSDITSVTIPESVTRIGDNAFENCTGISDIYYGGTVEQWNNIEFGGNWDKGTGNFVVHCADGDVNLIKPQLVDQNRDELTVGDERFGFLGSNPFETYISLSESLVGSDLRIFGWISSLSEIKSFGYSINDGEIITGEFEHYTEPLIYNVAKAPYASRFEIFAPITEDIQTIKAYLITEMTEEVIWEINISFIGNEFAFEENGDGTCKITGIGGKTETDLVIPSTINGLTVTAIGEGAFKECSDITSVTIPDTVTRIESWAFEYCFSLRSVVIPDSVNEIGEGAFRVCSNLESITIPNGVTRISNVTFEGCTVLTGVVIPGSVTEIGDGAFRDCSSLSSITIPESVTLIEDWAFERCTNLASIVIPDSVNVIGEGVFRECSNLESITISNGMNRISNILFEGCTGLTSVVLPENVTEIGDGAFRDCSNISSVTIPYSVNRIEGGAFERCTSLSDIYYGGTIEQWNAIDKDYYWDSGTNDYVVHCSDGDVNVTKPELVCASREEPTVNGVSVGDTSEEVSVALPTSMIGENLRLYGWVGSRSAIQGFGYSINDGAIITGDFAVEPEEDIIQEAEWQGAQYASRYAILVPLTEGLYTVKAYMITEKGEETFWMIHVAVSDEFAYMDNSDGTCTITGRGGHMESELVIPSTIQGLTVTQIGDGAFRDCTDITSVTLPESVTIINGWAFEGCSNLMSIVIPENVNEIGDGAFRACSNLESITISNGMNRISNILFEGCTGLTSVVLPENVTEIGDGAFRDCSNLSSVTIPDSVTLIQGWAFERCTGLSDIYYGGTIEQWNAVEKNVEWDKETGDYVVHCADGDVTKPQLVIVARDELKINDEGFINPGYGQNEDSISIPASLIGENLRIWGWVGSLSEIRGFGYTINDGEIITGEFEVDPGEDVVNAACDRGASFASRFAILVPVNDGAYTIKAYMITETTEEVIWVIHVTVVGQFSYEDNGDGTCTITGRGSHTESDLVIPSKIDGLTVTAIGENAFAGCEGLTSVTFSEKVSVIAENAFEGCTSLTDVFYGGDADQWANIAIADGNDALTAAEIHYGSLTGTPIGSAEDFLEMEDPAGDYYLTDDIYLTESYGEFSGTFNGNGHTVTVENCAVFDMLSGATVKNLIIEGSIERNGNTGGLANQGNKVFIKNVTNNATIINTTRGNKYFGGIIGSVLEGTAADSREYSFFIDCVNNGTITVSVASGTPRVGGITGNAAKYQWCVYENCVNNARLEATVANVSTCPYVGGIAGSAFGGEFTDCVNNGELVSENSAYIGGILSRATPSNQGGDQSVTCTNCINNGTLSCATGDGDYNANAGIGGIIGFAGAESNSNTFAVYSCIDCVNNGDIICGGYYAGGIIGKVQGNENCFELNNEFYHIVHIEGCTNTGNITGLRAAEQVESGTVQEATFVSQFLGFTDTAFNEIVDCKGYGTLTNTNNNYNVIFGIAANEYIPEEISAADILANATVSGIELIENDGTVNFTWSNDMGENGDRAGFRLTLAEYLAIEGNADKIIFVPEIPESGD